jgi:hypothetical protein
MALPPGAWLLANVSLSMKYARRMWVGIPSVFG